MHVRLRRNDWFQYALDNHLLLAHIYWFLDTYFANRSIVIETTKHHDLA